jgi:hypothetical protein
MPIKYGKKVVIRKAGDALQIEEENYFNFATMKQTTLYTETVKVKDEKALLAEFLTMLDQYASGDIDLPGIQLLRDSRTGQLRAEKTWRAPNLQ